MLAGLGVGIYRDAAEAIGACVRPDPPILPDPATVARYEPGFRSHRELVESSTVRQREG
jgi:hypothetical protein